MYNEIMVWFYHAQSEILIIALITVEFCFSYHFYRHEGKKSVYRTWYAWLIDCLAILGGLYAAGFALYLYYSAAVDSVLLLPMFIFGTWLGFMHLAKWLVRALR